MGVYDVLEGWAGELEGAGVPWLTDSRGQFSSPAGYVLLVPNCTLTRGLAGTRAVWFSAGILSCVVDGPYGTAQGKALDALVARAADVLGEFVSQIDYPDSVTLASVGIDQPAAAISYSNVPVSLTVLESTP